MDLSCFAQGNQGKQLSSPFSVRKRQFPIELLGSAHHPPACSGPRLHSINYAPPRLGRRRHRARPRPARREDVTKCWIGLAEPPCLVRFPASVWPSLRMAVLSARTADPADEGIAARVAEDIVGRDQACHSGIVGIPVDMHALNETRWEAHCGRCLRTSVPVPATSREKAWEEVERIGWTMYRWVQHLPGYAVCPGCSKERWGKVPTHSANRRRCYACGSTKPSPRRRDLVSASSGP
jgi:hypothetical protein